MRKLNGKFAFLIVACLIAITFTGCSTKLVNSGGKLENKKMIIEQYVDKVLIYKDHIEVRFNFGLGENEKKKPQNVPRQSDNSTVSSLATPMQNIDIIDGGEGGIRTLAALIEH